MLFQPTDNMSVLTGFTGGKGMNISVYSIRLHECEGAQGNQAGLRASSLRSSHLQIQWLILCRASTHRSPEPGSHCHTGIN